MPVTLAQAKLKATDDIDVMVIDEFRKNSFLLDAMTFDDVVNPAGGGATMTYGYTRLATQPTAQFRAINAEFTPQEVTRVRATTDLKVLGGAYEIDRVLEGVGAYSEAAFQAGQKIKASTTLFQDTVINGDSAVDANAFDGLDKVLVGSTTEFRPTTVTNWSTAPTEDQAHDRIDDLDEFLSLLDGTPGVLLGNRRLIAKIISLGRRAGYVDYTPDAFGRQVARYAGIPLVDAGEKAGTTDPIIPIESRTVGGVPTTGLTDLFAIRFGLDGFHGVSLAGRPLVRQFPPDFNAPGAVKKGEVEMVAGIALKATKSAAVFRNIKVQ